jgi:hypothetical protein
MITNEILQRIATGELGTEPYIKEIVSELIAMRALEKSIEPIVGASIFIEKDSLLIARDALAAVRKVQLGIA